MRKRRVLLLSDLPLLSQGLANLLGKIDDLDLVGPYSIAGFAVSDVGASLPDVVLCAAQETDDPAFNAVLFQILQHIPDLPVIQVGLSDNHIVRVYTSHTLPARSTDLIETIRRLPVQSTDDLEDQNSHPKE